MFAGSRWVGWDSKFVFRVTAQLDCGRSRAQRGSDGTCLHVLGFSSKTSAFARPSLKSPLYRDTIANKCSTQPCKVPGAEQTKHVEDSYADRHHATSATSPMPLTRTLCKIGRAHV